MQTKSKPDQLETEALRSYILDPASDPNEGFTVSEAAVALNLKTPTIYAAVNARQIGHQRLGPKRGKVIMLRRHILEYRDQAECPVESNAEHHRPNRKLLLVNPAAM